MLTHEEEIKVRLFKSIADNTDKLCATDKYFSPENVAVYVNRVYAELFGKLKEE